ncbi:glycogen/starch/alpha-glucan phosphorylase [Selenomonadales bacterium OttesenSCG-928-I06]|nr:glycogen/starch/alpha-glucan phosphorylase [Selenomonadales bacterium OttesenSCG-928-I06]
MFKDKEEFKKAFLMKLEAMFGQSLDETSPKELYTVLGSLIRDVISKKWYQTNKQYKLSGEKQVYYFSMEFLLGRLLGNNLLNLGIKDICREGLKDFDIDLNDMEKMEADAGLGNGGLGRLAACFLDSLASLQLPGHGCGIRYQHGLFEQKIVNGYQIELPDNWLHDGYVWEVRKPEKATTVKFGGDIQVQKKGNKTIFVHENYEAVRAVPYDLPVVGYNCNTVNNLRLWSAEADEFDFSSFSKGDYLKAVEAKYNVEATTQLLYPEDSHLEGKILRLKQQYFFVSAGIQSIVRRYKKTNSLDPKAMYNMDEMISIHINDTHPALAIPEIMRILMDEEGMGWDDAWNVTVKTVSYTNHTILPEALEKWPVDMFQALLPRIYMIVNEINERFCQKLWELYPGDWDKIRQMAIISDGYVHMAHLSVVGSHSINGVAKIHSEILKNQVMANFNAVYPHRFNNKTNGVTHRRWLINCNPELSKLITDAIGPTWKTHPEDLSKLEKFTHDSAFQEKIAKVKRNNKENLANYIKDYGGIDINLDSIFDVHVKRIHAYKRQILNILQIMDMYNRLKDNPNIDFVPRTFLFGGKAAPGYHLAKENIKLINTVADVINKDKAVRDKLRVVFIPNYSVSAAEVIIPAAEVSEQISTASKEASGTGNMKFMMNGAITICTLDGANVEIREQVGDENIVLFGLTAEQVIDYYAHGGYSSIDVCQNDGRIRRVVDQLVDGSLGTGYHEFSSIHNLLICCNDEFFILKDFAAYVDAQNKIGNYYKDKNKWNEMAINNIAFSGRFSTDRTISEYAIDIWKIKPLVVRSLR